MFRANTVLVVGAGASAEFGLPLGNALLKDIAQRIDISYQMGRLQRGDFVIAEALRAALDASDDVTEYNAHLHSAWQVVASAKQGISIDNVLHALEDERASRVGKYGIVRSILAAEEASPLSGWADHYLDKIDVAKFSDTWLGALTKIIIEGRTRSDVPDIFGNLSIINFNYDRIIEHYLPFSISSYYGVKPNDVREVMPSLQILRPYGKAGALPWETDQASVSFGHCSPDDLQVAAEQILTFTEQIRDETLVTNIRRVISEADRIIFLGFGFHRQNLDLIANPCQSHVEIIGTSLGVSNSDKAVISDEIEKFFALSTNSVARGHNYVKLLPLECAQFIGEIWRTLTAEPGEDPIMEFPQMEPNFPLLDFPRLR